MKIDLEPGVYVLAVSGGVDSMVLLHLLTQQNKNQVSSNKYQKNSQLPTPNSQPRLVVAHFEHGIREDSELDLHLVQETAQRLHMPFVFNRGNLGAGASEAKAREARYGFLRKAKEASGATAIVTAHHQDDVIETAILNMIRGTGPRGISSLKSTDNIVRPLLGYSKKDILEYANLHKIVWREDSTNTDEAYKRNYVRRRIVAKMTKVDREKMLELINKTSKTTQSIDALLPDYSSTQIATSLIVSFPHSVAKELVASWLKHHQITDVSQQKIEKLTIAAKTLQPGKKIDVDKRWTMQISKEYLALVMRER